VRACVCVRVCVCVRCIAAVTQNKCNVTSILSVLRFIDGAGLRLRTQLSVRTRGDMCEREKEKRRREAYPPCMRACVCVCVCMREK